MTNLDTDATGVKTLTAQQLHNLIQRYSEERSRVRFEGPRFKFLDEAIATMQAELDRRNQ